MRGGEGRGWEGSGGQRSLEISEGGSKLIADSAMHRIDGAMKQRVYNVRLGRRQNEWGHK